MESAARQKILPLLRILRDREEPLGSTQLARTLEAQNLPMHPRMIRNYLRLADEQGWTRNLGRRGRLITERGKAELAAEHTRSPLVTAASRFETMGFAAGGVTLAERPIGHVPLHLALAPLSALDRSAETLSEVTGLGLGMGRLMAVAHAGQTIAETTVPEETIAYAPLSELAIHAFLQAASIPLGAGHCGLLQFEQGEPRRIVLRLDWEGMTIDPLEILTALPQTDVLGIGRYGNGTLAVTWRGFPAAAIERVEEIIGRLHERGIGGWSALIRPGQRVYGLGVEPDRAALMLSSGFNPLLALRENEVAARIVPHAGLIDLARTASLGVHLAGILTRAFRGTPSSTL